MVELYGVSTQLKFGPELYGVLTNVLAHPSIGAMVRASRCGTDLSRHGRALCAFEHRHARARPEGSKDNA